MNHVSNSSGHLAPLSQRRRAVLIGAAGFLVLLLSQVLRGLGTESSLWNGLAAAGIVIMVFGWSRLVFPSFMGLPRPDQAHLDERQRAVLTAAYATAYQVLAAGLMLTVAYGIAAQNLVALPRLPESGNTTVAVGLLWVVISLPAAVLAWTEPDSGSDREA